MKKFSPFHVAIITALITVLICLSVYFFIMPAGSTPRSIGDTIVGGEILTTADENGKITSCALTYVYLGATSKLYDSEDATVSSGIFLDTFEDTDLAELIDSAGFPYKQEYVAVTSSTSPVRYMIKLENGTIFWVEP